MNQEIIKQIKKNECTRRELQNELNELNKLEESLFQDHPLEACVLQAHEKFESLNLRSSNNFLETHPHYLYLQIRKGQVKCVRFATRDRIVDRAKHSKVLDLQDEYFYIMAHKQFKKELENKGYDLLNHEISVRLEDVLNAKGLNIKTV